MKNSRKVFILVEAALTVMALIAIMIMLGEKDGKGLQKVSVVVQESDDGEWNAFKYGLRMAAEDQGVEMFVVSADEMTTEEQEELIRQEIDNGADAVIVQPAPGEKTEKMLKKLEKKVPIMLVECAAGKDGEKSEIPVTEADNYEIGIALADELINDCGENLNGKILQIYSQKTDSEGIINCEKGLKKRLKDSGIEVQWSRAASLDENVKNSLNEQEKADFIIALDDSSVVQAGEYAQAGKLKGAVVYGVGRSTEAVYWLDTGKVECLVVPDEFNIGYQSLTETAKTFKNSFYKMNSKTVSYTVIRQDTLFSKENQRILFTMSQ